MTFGTVIGINRLIEKHRKRARFQWADYCENYSARDPEQASESLGAWASEAMQIVGLLEALHVATEFAATEYHDVIVTRLAAHQSRKHAETKNPPETT